MTSTAITQHNLFRPAKSKSESKSEITDHTARAIIDAETERRESKTARLRQARLDKEASIAALEVPAKSAKAKTTTKRRSRVTS